MKVKNIMTKKIRTVKKQDKIKKVLKILTKYKITGCPVVDAHKNIIGIITQTDILKIIDVHTKINVTGTDFFSLLLYVLKSKGYNEMSEILNNIMEMRVSEFMNKRVITIGDEEDVYIAARKMNKFDIERLPVVKKKKLVGIITRWDIIKTLENIGEETQREKNKLL